jgi:hypothetical protein
MRPASNSSRIFLCVRISTSRTAFTEPSIHFFFQELFYSCECS